MDNNHNLMSYRVRFLTVDNLSVKTEHYRIYKPQACPLGKAVFTVSTLALLPTFCIGIGIGISP